MKCKKYILSELATIKYGKNQKKVVSDNGNIPIFGTGGLMGFASESLYDKPSVLIGRKGTIGKVKYVEQPFWTVDTLFYTIVNTDVVIPKYLYYLMSLIDLDIYNEGTTIPSLRTETLNRLEFDIPSLEEQRKILSCINPIDDKIEINNAINNNLLQQVTTLYNELVKSHDWPVLSILDVAEKVAMGPFGSNIKVSTFTSKGIPIISGNHLRGYFLEEPEFNYITEEHAERLKNSIVYPHDIVFTHAGNIGQVAIIPDGCKYKRYVLSQRQFYLRCNEAKVVPEFILLFFHSASGQHELLSYANQTGVPSIAQPATNLKKILFKCPPIETQLEWKAQVSPMIERYLNNRYENESLCSLRDSLLPKLMSGDIDVSNIDI
jgi:type I restriction modification DNA specificity domain protein (fragment)